MCCLTQTSCLWPPSMPLRRKPTLQWLVALWLVATCHTEPLRSDKPGQGANFPRRPHLCAFACSAVPSQQDLPARLQKMPLLICSEAVANWVTHKVLPARCQGPALPSPAPAALACLSVLPVPPTATLCHPKEDCPVLRLLLCLLGLAFP